MTNEVAVGRDLDVLVAQALGWTRGGGGWFAAKDDWRQFLPFWSESNDIAVALLAEATRRGWMWHADYGGPGYEIVVLMQGPLGGAAVQQAKGFAEAVSRAFVAAHEAEQKEKAK